MIENVTLEMAKNVYLLLDFSAADVIKYQGITFRHCIDSDGSESIGVEDPKTFIHEIRVKSGNVLEDDCLPCELKMSWYVKVVSIRTTHYHYCYSIKEWVKNK